MTLPEYFAGCLVINLPERTDSRREMERELARTNPPAGWAEFFPAVRPESAGGFPSVGAKGCFLSHLDVLREAHVRRWRSVLIMEDDLAIDPALAADPAPVVGALRGHDWDMAYLGHTLPDDPAPGGPMRLYSRPIATSHFLAVNGPCVPRLVEFLETVLARLSGHPDGGPMHVDGAYSTFRAQHPEVVTLVAARSRGGQRASRSDITPGWKDRVPVLRAVVSIARSARRLTGR